MTIKIDTDNEQLSEKILWLLHHFKEEGLQITSDDLPRQKTTNIFSKTKNILSSYNVDPLKWQNDIRAEWDR